MSDPTDDFVSMDEFHEELLGFMKSPLLPNEETLLKRCDSEQIEPDTWKITITLDGKKLQRMRFQSHDGDFVRLRQMLTIREKEGKVWWVRTADYMDAEFTERIGGGQVFFHTNPSRIEFTAWGRDDTERWHDDNVSWL